MFGLTNAQGNHGEDVKELYYYLDGVPTHAYMKMLYKYPQSAFPYADLVAVNAARGLGEREYELFDTGVFNENRYLPDVEIEYAKASADDVLLLITAHNRGPRCRQAAHTAADLGSQSLGHGGRISPNLCSEATGAETHRRESSRIGADADDLRRRGANSCSATTTLTSPGYLARRRWDGSRTASTTPWSKGKTTAVNQERRGTKAAAHYVFDIPAGESVAVRVRLSPQGRRSLDPRFRRGDGGAASGSG